WHLLHARRPPTRQAVTARFQSAGGDIPITLGHAPPGSAHLSAQTMHELEYFFAGYANFGKERHVTVWLVYMPCKARVVYGQVTFSPDAPRFLQDWTPTDLPLVLERLSRRYGVRFVDLTPVLRRPTVERKELLFNSIQDTHLNARGSAAVAHELARRLASEDPSGVAP